MGFSNPWPITLWALLPLCLSWKVSPPFGSSPINDRLGPLGFYKSEDETAQPTKYLFLWPILYIICKIIYSFFFEKFQQHFQERILESLYVYNLQVGEKLVIDPVGGADGTRYRRHWSWPVSLLLIASLQYNNDLILHIFIKSTAFDLGTWSFNDFWLGSEMGYVRFVRLVSMKNGKFDDPTVYK